MSVRVGRIVDNKHPSFEGYKPIVVMTKSSAYGDIGPYCLKNEEGQLMENIYQFSKVYEKVPKSTQRYSKWDSRIIWDWPAETHVVDGEVNDQYWSWREAGYNAHDPIRYPVGLKNRHLCLYSLWEGEKLDYIQSRKKIYMPTYQSMVIKHDKFKKIKEMVTRR